MILKKSMPFLFIPLFISLIACSGDQNDITNEFQVDLSDDQNDITNESQVDLPDDFIYTAYWGNNEKVQETCGKSDSLCIEEHWFNIGEPAGLSYLSVEEISSSSVSTSSAFVSSSSVVSSSSEEISSSSESSSSGTFTDSRDSKTYKTTTIGTQVWMAENLNYETTSGSYCYDDNSTNCDTYGRLYTWSAAMNGASSSSTSPSGVKGVCPTGWHLPSDAEWTELSDYVIANSARASTDDIGSYLKSTSGWNSSGNGTDDFGFSALPGGDRTAYRHDYVGYNGIWWSSTEFSSTYAAYRRSLNYSSDSFYRNYHDKSYALSVRCLQDTP